MLNKLLLSVIIGLSSTAQADITAVESLPGVVEINGQINKGDEKEFLQYLIDNPDTVLVGLNSRGGHLYTALAIGHMIKTAGISTAIAPTATCASACSLVFMAGEHRYPSGKLGVHRPALLEEDAEMTVHAGDHLNLVQSMVGDLLTTTVEWDIPQNFFAQWFDTPSDEMYYFTEDELKEIEK